MFLRADVRRIRSGRSARFRHVWPLLLSGFLCCGGCLTFSSFQTARIPETDRPEVTAAVTHSDFREDRDSGWSMLEFRRRSRLGGSAPLEGHVKLSFLRPDNGEGLGGVLGAGLKVPIVRDHLAVGLPVSWYVGDVGFRLLQFHPGVIATLPIIPGFDLNGDIEMYVLAGSGMRPLRARHLGLAIGPADRRWAVRPEIGWLGWDDGYVRETSVQFGLAVEFHERPREALRRTGGGEQGVI